MRAKEYLSQVRFLDERITCKLADAARLQDMATRITPILREDGVSGGGGAPDRLADAVAKIVDLKAEINRDIDRLVDKKRDIAAKLGKLTDRRYYAVLFRRYLLFETFEKISCEMNYSWRHVCPCTGRRWRRFKRCWTRKRRLMRRGGEFQSTLPTRGATMGIRHWQQCVIFFNPAPHAESHPRLRVFFRSLAGIRVFFQLEGNFSPGGGSRHEQIHRDFQRGGNGAHPLQRHGLLAVLPQLHDAFSTCAGIAAHFAKGALGQSALLALAFDKGGDAFDRGIRRVVAHDDDTPFMCYCAAINILCQETKQRFSLFSSQSA